MRKKSSYLLIWGWFDWIFSKLHIDLRLYSYWYNSAIVIVKKRNELGFYLIDPEGSTQRDEMIFHWFTYHGSSRCQTLRWLICSFDSNVYFYLHCLMMFWYADDKNISGYMFLFWYFNWLLFSKWDCTFSLKIKWIIHTSWKPKVVNFDDIIGKWFWCLLSLSTII